MLEQWGSTARPLFFGRTVHVRPHCTHCRRLGPNLRTRAPQQGDFACLEFMHANYPQKPANVRGRNRLRRDSVSTEFLYPSPICERLIGTIRRECLDWLIPMSEIHLRNILKSWAEHYNRGRAHMSLGPGLPDPPSDCVPPLHQPSQHRLGGTLRVKVKSRLGGLHHEYALQTAVTWQDFCGPETTRWRRGPGGEAPFHQATD